jgi:hypothetical protein
MPLHKQIAELLTLPENGAGAPSLAAVEATLTDGYARALALDAERWRIARRLGEVLRDAGGEATAGELTHLSKRLSSAEGELADLRALLRSLQDRARTIRDSRA